VSPPPEGFWQRHDVRRFLPVAIGVTAFAVLLLTLTLVPRRESFLKKRDSAAKPATERATVTEERVALKAAAESRAPAVKDLPRGAAVTLETQSNGLWCRVTDPTGQAGYVPCRSVERNSDRNARARRADTIFKFAPLTGSVASTTALRLAPFPFAPVWGEAPAGSSVEIYSVDHGYYAVKLPDGTLGFLASADVDLIPANPSEPALTPAAGKVVKGISVSEINATATPPPPGAESGSSAPPPLPPVATAAVPPEGVGAESFSVAPAVLLQKVDPGYPPAALAARVGGTVVLQISIDASGDVTKVEVRREATMGLTEAAVEAVRRWKYRPATGPSGPIPSLKQVKVDFRPPE
jgi:periplasmic protein TonB